MFFVRNDKIERDIITADRKIDHCSLCRSKDVKLNNNVPGFGKVFHCSVCGLPISMNSSGKISYVTTVDWPKVKEYIKKS